MLSSYTDHNLTKPDLTNLQFDLDYYNQNACNELKETFE